MGSTILYQYNATGQKLTKTVRDNDSIKIVRYLDGFQYAGDILQFFPTTEGYVKATPVGNANPDLPPTGYAYNYTFNYTDHLGNIRLSYTKDPQSGTLQILEENHYYPFGLRHEIYVTGSKRQHGFGNDGGGGDIDDVELINVLRTDYQYKYNGKEWQDELGLNMYAMDMRMYDPAIARWVVQDPIVHFNQSTYSAFDGNPVFWADPSGAAVEETEEGYVFTGEDAKNLFRIFQNKGDKTDCETCDKTYADALSMIKSARKAGMNFAADNLEYFLSGNGSDLPTKEVSPQFIFSQQSVKNGIAGNIQKLFDKKFNNLINNIGLGQSISLQGKWIDSYYAYAYELDLLYGSGGYEITTEVDLTVSRGKIPGFNGYTISGSITVRYRDEYNWDPGKGDYVPGYGYTEDSDFDLLRIHGRAGNFEMKSSTIIKINTWVYTNGGIRSVLKSKLIQ